MRKFLESVIGVDGSRALVKAIARSEDLAGAFVPRVIMAWLTAEGDGFDGLIPGTSERLRFVKTEGRYTGSVLIDSRSYSFDSVELPRLAANVAVAVGLPPKGVSDEIKALDLVRLGKSIDLLVKARFVLQKAYGDEGSNTPQGWIDPTGNFHPLQGKERHNQAVSRLLRERGEGGDAWDKEIEGAYDKGWISVGHAGQMSMMGPALMEPNHPAVQGLRKLLAGKTGDLELMVGEDVHSMPVEDFVNTGPRLRSKLSQFHKMAKQPSRGQAAAHIPPIEPVPHDGPQAVQQGQAPSVGKTPKKPPKFNVLKSQQKYQCPRCSGTQFSADVFVGCLCFVDLAKSVKTTKESDSLVLEFSGDCNPDDISVLLSIFNS